MITTWKAQHHKGGWINSFLIIVVIIGLLFSNVPGALASTPVEVGYRDFSYPKGTGGNSEPTGEKPESKLWWNDGYWWGSLWSTAGNAYHIYRLELSTQDWIDTGVAIDDRLDSRADALWDGQRLYLVSHIFAPNAGAPAGSGQRGELYRYSYNSQAKTYSLDAGFPIEVTGGKSETLVIEKDSGGTLWVTYVENSKVLVNHSLNGDDRSWGTPFVLPVSQASVSSDDISSVIAYNNHIGVMWSNQVSPKEMYFAVHPVGSPDSVWTQVRTYSVSGDDHISLKSLETDSAGNVYAAIKTSRSANLIVLIVCKNNINRCKTESDWDAYTAYDGSHSPTRPILLIDSSNRELYIFTRNKDAAGNSAIYYKKSPLDNIQFSIADIGVPFIKSATETGINDPTSTKQNLTTATGMVVLASDGGPDVYMHNYMSLGSSNAPVITSFSPTEGIAGASVTISGSNFSGTTAVAFNGMPASGFTVATDTQISATVPSGATTGPISVTNADGTATSASDFVVIVAPAIASFTPTEGPVGTQVTVTGSGFSGTTSVTFNGTAASAFTVDSDTQISATVPSGATTGPISVTNAVGTATSSASFTVTTAPAQHTLTVNVVGSGSVTLDPPGGVYDAGTVVQLTATPDPGWIFTGWNGALSGTANPASLAMDSDKDVSATFQQESGGGGSVTFEEAQSGGSSSSLTVATSASLAGVSGDLYLAAISFKPSVAVQSVEGLGLSWTRVRAQCAGRNQTGVEVWMAQGTPNGNSSVSATFWDAPVNAVIAASRYSGVNTSDPIGNLVYGNTNGVDGACSGGSDSNSYSFNLNTTVNGSAVFGAAAMRSKSHTPGSGYTERVEASQGRGGGMASVALEDQTFAAASPVILNGSFSGNIDWAVVGVEIQPGSGSPPSNVPSIASFDPTSGPAGTSVTIAGSNFSGTTSVEFNGTPASVFSEDSDTQITATVPNAATTGPISVTNADGTGSSASDFVVIVAPQITSFSPTSGPVGTEVTLTGNGFTGTTEVTFNGTPASAFTVDSDTQIRATVPSDANNGEISVTNPAGTAWSTQNFLVTAAPGISAFSPASGPAGTVVTITGLNFNGTTTVAFNGVPAAAFSVDSDTQISATVPSGATSGPISVTNADGTATSATDFVVIVAPAISSFSPTEGPVGTQVTVTGSGFTGTTEVTFNGTAVSAFTVDSDTQLRASVPDGATTGPISVTNPAGTATSSASFTVTTAPVQHTLTVNVVGSGSVALDPPGGTYDAGTVVQLTATPDPGWIFTGWSGALSGTANPASLTMDANKSVTATFQQESGGGGSVTFAEAQSGGSSSSLTVATSASLTGVSGDLYLAAISFKPSVAVESVEGLGLSWTRVRAQCAGRNQTGVEVWMAQGTPSSDGVVSASLEAAPVNAVIAVSRYSGVNPSSPIGNPVSGNTNGVDGACSGGVDSSSYSFNLDTTVDGSVVFGAVAMRSKSHTPGSGYVERLEVAQGGGGGTASLALVDQTFLVASPAILDGSLSGSVDWAVIGLEIKP